MSDERITATAEPDPDATAQAGLGEQTQPDGPSGPPQGDPQAPDFTTPREGEAEEPSE